MSNGYCAYLRKSRQDVEAERRGEGETLARHERQLTDLAKAKGVTISHYYREIVSGDSIAARPEMLTLLDDIESGRWAGVFVVEVERLARGDTRDQGLLLQTFKYNSVKIITPAKTYDPNNEFDEEYFEFGLFMSRREYMSIKRRLINGKIASSKEGKFAGGRVPYGYEKYKLSGEKGFSLRIIPDQATVVNLIYEMYLNGTYETGNRPAGASVIALALNDMHIKPISAEKWSPGVIRNILTNCVYVGQIRWGRRKTVKVIKNGVVTNSHPTQSNYMISDGMHDPIISQETWDNAQKTFNRRTRRPGWMDNELKNPFAGILQCGICHKTMIRRPGKKNEKSDWFICATHECKTCGSKFDVVENEIILSLEEWLSKYKTTSCTASNDVIGLDTMLLSIKGHTEALECLKKQLDKAYTLLETEIYTLPIFQERSQSINAQLTAEKQILQELNEKVTAYEKYEAAKQEYIPKFEYLLDNYQNLEIIKKNSLLKELVEKIEYFKEERGTKATVQKFKLKIYPRI